ncbi:MAG: AAA family ATPase [Bacteroidota bacterium]
MEYNSNTQLKLAFDYVQFTGKNIFLTGKAGTGKTTFLHNLKNVSHKRLVVVAPTGVAAINANGVTIHSFFQLPFGPQIPGAESPTIKSKTRRFNKDKINIIRSMDLLVIDEISMVRADLLDGIDSTLRRFRNRNLPFGGVQLLMIGDLQQLAPVVKDDEWYLLRDHYKTAFFFSSKALQLTQFVSIELLHVFRQSDEKFISLLNSVRDNKIDNDVIDALNARWDPNFDLDKAGYIILTTHNAKAKEINVSRLNRLKEKPHSFRANVSGIFPEYIYPTDFELVLKKGAQVMFVKNDPNPAKEYYNGKIGKITNISSSNITVECVGDDELIEVGKVEWEKMKYTLDDQSKEIKETVEGVFTQYPLKLAWAITIHKSQGLTFENAVIDAQAAFAHGQVYVALSRCKTLEGMVLSTPIQRQSIKHDSTINNFTKDVEENQPDEEQLLSSKNAYQLELLSELFDFKIIHNQINYAIKLFQEHYSSLQNNPVDEFINMNKNVRMEIVVVGDKFRQQLHALFNQNNDIEDNAELQNRVKKAAPYFIAKMTEIIDSSIHNFVLETDNKVVKKQIKNVLEKLQLDYLMKQKCLAACNNGFLVDNYLKTRALASIEEAKAPVKIKSSKVASSANDSKELYRVLKAWRDARAEELDWEVYRVIQLKTMNEICDKLPSTPQSLSAINGMGKVKMEMFSDELLDIINDYRDENNITDTAPIEPEIPIKIPKKKKIDTKKVSLDLLISGRTIKEIAKERGFVLQTVERHLLHYVDIGELNIDKIIDKNSIMLISDYLLNHSFSTLTETREGLKSKFTYSEINFVLHKLLYENKITRPDSDS